MSSDRKQVLETLRGLGVTEVVAEYSGSGDEGFIDDILFTGGTMSRKVQNQLNDFFWDMLCDSSWSGFWNGEPGGYGKMVWNIVTDKMAIHHTEYVMDEKTHDEDIIEADYEEVE